MPASIMINLTTRIYFGFPCLLEMNVNRPNTRRQNPLMVMEDNRKNIAFRKEISHMTFSAK
jgi:hypothetical protein